MDLSFTNDQLMVRNMAREFATKELEPKAAEIDEKGEFPHDSIKKMAELGMLSMTIPEKYGGAAFDFMSLAIAIEEISRACASTGVIVAVHNSLACWPIVNWGTDAQKEKYLPGIASGKSVATLAMTEKDARYEAQAVVLKATAGKDGYVLTGTKMFVPDAGSADWMLVVARTGDTVNPERGITVFIVDAKSSGISYAPLAGMARDKLFEVAFHRVKVPRENVVGEVGKGWEIARRTAERAAAMKCCDMVGVLQRVLEMTLDYAKERKQFEKPIGSFQVIQHYLAEIATDVDGARFSAYQAAWRLAEGKPCLREVAIAKTFAADAFERTITKSHQIFGAIGVTIDHDLHFYTTRGKAAMLSYGDSDFWREAVAQAMGL